MQATTALIDQHIIQDFIQNEEAEYTKCRKASEIAAKILFGVGVGSIATIPFAPLSINFAKRLGLNEYFGYGLVAANSLSFFCITLWANFENVEILSTPKTDLERRIQRKKLACLVASSFVAATVLGILSQAPFAYLAYNEGNHNIIMPILVVIADCSYPILSLNRTLEKMGSLISSNERRISKLKTQVIQKLDQGIETLDTADVDTLSEHIDAIFFGSEQTQLSNMKRSLFSENHLAGYEGNGTLKKVTKAAEAFGKLVGLVCVVSELTSLAVLSYQGGGLIWDSTAGSTILSVATTSIQAYLTFVVYVDTGSYFSRKTVETLSCTRKKGIAEKQYCWIPMINAYSGPQKLDHLLSYSFC